MQRQVYKIVGKLHGQKPTKAQKMQLIAYGVLAEKIYKKEYRQIFFIQIITASNIK